MSYIFLTFYLTEIIFLKNLNNLNQSYQLLYVVFHMRVWPLKHIPIFIHSKICIDSPLCGTHLVSYAARKVTHLNSWNNTILLSFSAIDASRSLLSFCAVDNFLAHFQFWNLRYKMSKSSHICGRCRGN